MSTQKFLSVPVLLLAAAGLFSSCKKDDAPPMAKNCNIITVTPNTGDALNFTYNPDGKISSYTSGNIKVVYGYNGNTIIANSTTNGAFGYKKTITTAANGFTSNVKTETTANGSSWYNDAYEYSGTELIKATTTNSGNAVPVISTIAWSGGNLVSITTNNMITKVDYYLDVPGQKGDYMDVIQQIQNIRIYQTKNAIKSLLSNGNISSMEYSFGAEGITVMKFSDANSTLLYNYQYQCN